MTRRFLHVMLALGLALSVFAGTFVTGSASEHNNDGPTEIFLPWVPNGTVIDDPRDDFGTTGPYYGTVTVQNLEEHQITVHYEATATGETGSVALDGWASTTLDVDDLFNENDVVGSGVYLWTDNNDRFAAVQKQAADVPPHDGARTSDDHITVAGYTGLTEIGGNFVLPIVQTNNNWNTLIRMTNFDNEIARVDITLHEAFGEGDAIEDHLFIQPGETATFDLLAEDVPDGWTGSARISTNFDVAAVAERVKNETNMLIMNSFKLEADVSTQYAPLVFREFEHWNTGISVANLAATSNVVTITYYSRDGEFAGEDELIVPPNGMAFEYTPATVLENDEEEAANGFVGSAIISGTSPFHGSVDEVKYFGDDLDTGHAMSYMLEDESIDVGQSLALPLMQKGVQVTAFGDTTGIQLFNPDEDDSAAAAIWFFDQAGNIAPGSPQIETLGPREGATIYAFHIDELPEHFQGSAIVQHVHGEGQITGISNNVNYEVVVDGSASFNLIRTGVVGPPAPPWVTVDASDLHGASETEQGDIVATAVNPSAEAGGVEHDPVRFRITVEGPEPCNGTDWEDWFEVVGVNGNGPENINATFDCDNAAFVGFWGPETGFPMPPGHEVTTTFTVEVNAAPTGTYVMTVELFNVVTDDVLALDADEFEIVNNE